MRRVARTFVGVVAATVGLLGLAAAPGNAAGISSVLPITDPAPGPGGCSVDIVNRELGSYAQGRLTFTYDLAGPACAGGLYGLVVLNTFDRRQVALYTTRGDGRSTTVTFDRALPFAPTPDPKGGAPAGSGLCVIGFTELRLSVADVAPNQPASLRDLLSSPNCSPLFNSLPVGGARAFH